MREAPPGYIANFDSASAMLRATARFLKGRDFPALGLGRAVKLPQRHLDRVPRKAREAGHSVAAANEAIRPSAIRRVSDARLARWATDLYPDRRYPAAVIGSSSGALVNLCAALGIPWLPQTFSCRCASPTSTPTSRATAWTRVSSRAASCSSATPRCSCTTCTTRTRTACRCT